MFDMTNWTQDRPSQLCKEGKETSMDLLIDTHIPPDEEKSYPQNIVAYL